MNSPADEQVLDLTQAARLIFNTAEPTDEQVLKVHAEIKRGALRCSRQGGVTTTAEAVADYFASKATANLVAHAPSEKPAAKRNAPGAEPEVAGVYQTLLKDYFLGIFMQRQTKQYPDFFQRAVLAGQIALLLGMLAIFFWVFADVSGMLGMAKTPQRIAVEKWIEAKHGPFEIVTVAPGPEETDLVVKYRYRAASGKSIETQRLFRVDDGNVSLVVSD